MEPPEIIEVESEAPNVACDGGGDPLGCPRVFLAFEREGLVDCPYCGRRFVRKASRSKAAE